MTDRRAPLRRAAPAQTGTLLAVCALCGGAGASTLSYLVGADAAARGGDPVLVCDAGESTGGLSAYAGVESLRSLAELANDVAAGVPVADGMFAEASPHLRLIAAGPRLEDDVDADAAAGLLANAREEHPLTIVDCGRAGTVIGRLALAAASHVAWVLPATVSGVVRSRRVLDLFARDVDRRELVVTRFDPGGRQPPMDELAAIAESRAAPLVLMPHVSDLGERDVAQALEEAQVTLEAIHSLLRR